MIDQQRIGRSLRRSSIDCFRRRRRSAVAVDKLINEFLYRGRAIQSNTAVVSETTHVAGDDISTTFWSVRQAVGYNGAQNVAWNGTTW